MPPVGAVSAAKDATHATAVLQALFMLPIKNS
jgi:hypothetical protein